MRLGNYVGHLHRTSHMCLLRSMHACCVSANLAAKVDVAHISSKFMAESTLFDTFSLRRIVEPA